MQKYEMIAVKDEIGVITSYHLVLDTDGNKEHIASVSEISEENSKKMEDAMNKSLSHWIM